MTAVVRTRHHPAVPVARPFRLPVAIARALVRARLFAWSYRVPESEQEPVTSFSVGGWWVRIGRTGVVRRRPLVAWHWPHYVGLDYAISWLGFFVGVRGAG